MPSRYIATIGTRTYQIELLSQNQVSVDGEVRHFDLVETSDRSLSLILDGRIFTIERGDNGGRQVSKAHGAPEPGSEITVVVNGAEHLVRVDNEHSLALRSLIAHQGSSNVLHEVRAPMPGLISRIEVQVGDVVAAGRGLLVLEAMKMENEIRSQLEGKIQTIHVTSGKAVEKGELLVTIQTS